SVASMPANDRAAISADFRPAFTVYKPNTQVAPFALCSPHSGRVYPSAFLAASRLDAHALRKSEDCYVDDLFAGVAAIGVPLISAPFPRAYPHVKKESYEL